MNALRKLVSVHVNHIRVIHAYGYAIECVIDRIFDYKCAFEYASEFVNASMNRCVNEGCCMLAST